MVGPDLDDLDIVAEPFNLLNRQNIIQVNPVFGSDLTPGPQFSLPILESDARRVQFSLDSDIEGSAVDPG